MRRPRYKGYRLVKVFSDDPENEHLIDATMRAEGAGMETKTVGWHNENLLYVSNRSLLAWGVRARGG